MNGWGHFLMVVAYLVVGYSYTLPNPYHPERRNDREFWLILIGWLPVLIIGIFMWLYEKIVG